jgi:hypothetical protein
LVVASNRPLYGNLRQLYFILPPLFLWVAWSIEMATDYLPGQFTAVIFIGILLLPGIFNLIVLHPYQYAYYNALVGGSQGANGRFALDYWCTSYREAMAIVNQDAPEGAEIGVWGPLMSAKEFAREDLVVELVEDFNHEPDYVLGCWLALQDEDFYSNMTTLLQVDRAGAVFGIVKAKGE